MSLGTNAAKNRPVSKVITLLKDMKEQLEKEGSEDEEVYDKVACWCSTNDKEKTQAIANAEARITDLTSKVEELTAQSARLNQEIKSLEQEVAKNQASLDTATALRQKQLGDFNGEEKEMLQCINALKSAIVILSKHHPGGALLDEGSMLQIAEMIRDQLHKHKKLLMLITPRQRKLIKKFMQTPEKSLLDVGQTDAPQSGEIFGVLKQMLETFQGDLNNAQKEELANSQAYEELKTAKEAEITAGQSALQTKTQEVASADEKKAQAKEDIEDTTNTLSADEKFLMDLKQKCQMTDQEWEERQKTRQEEISAVSEAISILSADDAHDLFSKTFNPAFVQSSDVSQIRQHAADLVLATGKRLNLPAMISMATRIRLDAFAKVKEAIDKMVTQLQKEQADEVKHRDYCVDSLNQNAKSTESSSRDKSDVNMQIEDLTMSIQALDQEIETLKSEITESQTQLKRAGEDRELENREFQGTVADQRASQKLLNQALSVLKGFYNKKAVVALSQASHGKKQDPASPPGFSSYKKQNGAGGVMGMIQQIISDSKTLEAQAIHAEEEAQKAYESYVKETNRSIEEKSTSITNKSEDKAKAEGEKTEAEQSKEEVVLSLEQLANDNADLHKSCDFVMKNFDIRQEARDQEVEALKQAKAILSGAKFTEYLQQQ